MKPRGYWDKNKLLEVAKEIWDVRGSLSVSVWREEIGGFPWGSVKRNFGKFNKSPEAN